MLYEHNGKLLRRTANGFERVTLKIAEDGGYQIISSGETVASRPLGATPTDVRCVVARYQLVAGSIFPKPEEQPKASANQKKDK